MEYQCVRAPKRFTRFQRELNVQTQEDVAGERESLPFNYCYPWF